jgi:hypothetical protein
MNFFTPPRRLVLFSRLSPDECASRLEQAIDPDDFALFAFSGYRGVKPFLGGVTDRQFRVFERGYRNIPPVFSGAFLSQGLGTRVEGVFELELTSKIAICLLSLFGVLVMTPIVLYSLRDHTVPAWMAVAFACVYFTGALLAPRIVRGIGVDQERDIADFLCGELEADRDLSACEPGGQS